MLGDIPDLDVEAAEEDVLEAAKALLASHPEVGAIVLECTNMMPYAAAIRRRTDLPVYDMYSFATWFHYGLEPRRFPRDRNMSPVNPERVKERESRRTPLRTPGILARRARNRRVLA